MTRVRICFTALGLAACVATSTGCSLLHDLQPHRLHRLNRQAAPSSDANFSVEDNVGSSDSVRQFMSSTSRIDTLEQ